MKGIDNRVSKAIVRALEKTFPLSPDYVASKTWELKGKDVTSSLAFCVNFDSMLMSSVAHELDVQIEDLMATARVLNKI